MRWVCMSPSPQKKFGYQTEWIFLLKKKQKGKKGIYGFYMVFIIFKGFKH